MYEVAGLPGAQSFEPGTTLLVTGDTHRSRDLVIDMLAGGTPSQAAILTVTDAGSAAAVRAFEGRGADTGRVGIIDCTNDEAGADLETAARIRSVNSPGDLTGISVEFAKLAQAFRDEVDEIRVGLASISTVLMYTDSETAFRFLHVYASRIRSGGMFGVFTMDPAMHDGQVVSTIRAIFAAEAQVGAEGVELRGTGYR